MDTAIFLVTTTVGAAAFWAMKRKRGAADGEGLLLVDANNQALPSLTSPSSKNKEDQEAVWCRATYSLVMHEPPHLFYEPRDWSCTTVLLLKPLPANANAKAAAPLQLPGGPLWKQENYHDSAIRHLKEDAAIDVCQPENCLHHLFTFPYDADAGGEAAALAEVQQAQILPHNKKISGVWGDFYECVYRGKMEDLQATLLFGTKKESSTRTPRTNPAQSHSSQHQPKYSLVSMTLAELQHALTQNEQESTRAQDSSSSSDACSDDVSFAPDTLYALKLYFQRQGDLRVQRRLLKGYSSADLEHYGLRAPQERAAPILRDFQDDQRQAAVDFTLKTDDGMAPRMLPQADLVLLGVSRAGKTPLSIFIAQTMGLKVSNVPLVKELDPPQQLLVEQHHRGKHHHRVGKDQVDPRRVFCLTMQPEYLQRLRMTRLRRELKKQIGQQQGQSIYATLDYVQKDVQKAKDLCLTYGFTEIDVTGRAMEETAFLIVSKLKERFPDEVTRAQSVHIF